MDLHSASGMISSQNCSYAQEKFNFVIVSKPSNRRSHKVKSRLFCSDGEKSIRIGWIDSTSELNTGICDSVVTQYILHYRWIATLTISVSYFFSFCTPWLSRKSSCRLFKLWLVTDYFLACLNCENLRYLYKVSVTYRVHKAPSFLSITKMWAH